MATIYNGIPYQRAINNNSLYQIPQFGTQFRYNGKTDLKDPLTKSILNKTDMEELDILSDGITKSKLNAMNVGLEGGDEPVIPKVDGKSLSTIGAANIATGISTLANVASSIYGATQASKMKPSLMKFQAPIEPVLVNDNSSAIQSAGQENIDKSINTARANYQRNGIYGVNGLLLSKENEGLNQLSANLAQYRTGIDTQNAQIQNTVNAQNKQTDMQVDQFNAGTNNQFDQYKSGLVSMGMKNATDTLQSGVESIFGNMMAGSQMQLSSITSEMSSIMQQLNNPVTSDLSDLKQRQAMQERLKELQSQKLNLENGVFGQQQLKA